MPTFEPLDDGVEVRGSAILSIVNGVPDAFTGQARELLAENGIEDPQPDEWYSQAAYLDAYRAVADRVGERTLEQIGRSTPENAEWPPGVDTPLAALESVDDAYQMNHRGGEIGSYEVVDGDDGRATVRCRNPYPCVYDQGLLQGTVEVFSDDYASIDETSDRCREDGADACTYEVTW
ncbi:hypothetical protein RYH80_07725 [Halobaculum sp. MBLA0147]|uniref:hypothetical protein n=1 Tax=Halobaculum sp. MBLA0147 TaxID=3079934 RepID=UPI003525D300